MSIHQEIENKLRAAFNPNYLQVENESFRHSVPPDSESHFKIVMVAEAFQGQPLVARHQSVYNELAQELNSGVHALALHLHSVDEWQEKEQSIPDSPNCLGGSKAR